MSFHRSHFRRKNIFPVVNTRRHVKRGWNSERTFSFNDTLVTSVIGNCVIMTVIHLLLPTSFVLIEKIWLFSESIFFRIFTPNANLNMMLFCLTEKYKGVFYTKDKDEWVGSSGEIPVCLSDTPKKIQSGFFYSYLVFHLLLGWLGYSFNSQFFTLTSKSGKKKTIRTLVLCHLERTAGGVWKSFKARISRGSWWPCGEKAGAEEGSVGTEGQQANGYLMFFSYVHVKHEPEFQFWSNRRYSDFDQSATRILKLWKLHIGVDKPA